MAMTLEDIRFIVERDIEDALDNKAVIDWSNVAQNDFMLRIFIPDSTTISVNTTDVSYAVPSDLRDIRRIRRQSDLDNNINRPYHPVYTLYNGVFEVPVPFGEDDTLLIDYYRYLTFFTDITDLIDLPDRFSPLYSSYIESRYYRLPSVIKNIGQDEASLRHANAVSIYNAVKKQVTDAYNIEIGIQKPRESGW